MVVKTVLPESIRDNSIVSLYDISFRIGEIVQVNLIRL